MVSPSAPTARTTFVDGNSNEVSPVFSNALLPIDVSKLFPCTAPVSAFVSAKVSNVTEARSVQPLNALLPSVCIVAGKVTFFSLYQFWKACLPSDFSLLFAPKFTLSSSCALENALSGRVSSALLSPKSTRVRPDEGLYALLMP